MIIFFAVISMLLSLAGFGLFWLVAFFPKLGSAWLVNPRNKRMALHGAAILVSLFIFSLYSVSGLYILLVNLIFVMLTNILVPENIFPALDFSKHVSAKDNPYDPKTEIIALNIDKTSIAYPLWELIAPHHIINDRIKNSAFAITFCPVCRSVMVYSAKTHGYNMKFRVAGLFRKNMCFVDSATNSLWQQADGRCIDGRLKGKILETIPFRQLKLGEWMNEFSKTWIAVLPENSKKSIIPAKLFPKLFHSGMIRKIHMPGLSPKDNRLDAHTTVAGIRIDNLEKAYPVEILKAEKTIIDKIADKTIILKYSRKSGEITAKLRKSKKLIQVERQWWLSWHEFYPDTLVYKE